MLNDFRSVDELGVFQSRCCDGDLTPADGLGSVFLPLAGGIPDITHWSMHWSMQPNSDISPCLSVMGILLPVFPNARSASNPAWSIAKKEHCRKRQESPQWATTYTTAACQTPTNQNQEHFRIIAHIKRRFRSPIDQNILSDTMVRLQPCRNHLPTSSSSPTRSSVRPQSSSL